MLPKNRQPTHPGEIIRYEYLEELNMTQQQLADAIGITRVRIKKSSLENVQSLPILHFDYQNFLTQHRNFG